MTTIDGDMKRCAEQTTMMNLPHIATRHHQLNEYGGGEPKSEKRRKRSKRQREGKLEIINRIKVFRNSIVCIVLIKANATFIDH